jgi:hypothetical protein
MLDKSIKRWLEDVVGNGFKLNPVIGRANSRVFKIVGGKEEFALKIYPNKEYDRRDRLGTEFDALRMLGGFGLNNIPKALEKNSALNVALYEWVDGSCISKINIEEIEDALTFVESLNEISKSKEKMLTQLASEACLSAEELVSQISYRRDRLSKLIEEQELVLFIREQFNPVFDKVKKFARENWKISQQFDVDLPVEYRTLSPSDFGFHNAIHRKDGGIVYIDFEYFGWDDPVKLTSDFIWHAGMMLTDQAKSHWLEGMKSIFSYDPEFNERFVLFHPFYGLRWCMILLNEFLPGVWEIRKHADQGNLKSHNEIKQIQLAKAKKYLEEVQG